MSETVALAMLAAAISIMGMAVAAFWKIIDMVRDVDRRQDQHRHDLRGELHIFLNDTIERLERRIERLEGLSYGFRDRDLRHPGGDDDD